MKKITIGGKEYMELEQCDIDKLPPMSYPKDLLERYRFSGFCCRCCNEKIACVCMGEDELKE